MSVVGAITLVVIGVFAIENQIAVPNAALPVFCLTLLSSTAGIMFGFLHRTTGSRITLIACGALFCALTLYWAMPISNSKPPVFPSPPAIQPIRDVPLPPTEDSRL
jgi:hypothetical protein